MTGGSRGLGFAAAQALVADGARVLISAPHEATAASAVARLTPGAARTGAGGSIVFVLASVRVPLAELAISNGLFPCLAGVVKTLAGELGPTGIRVNGVLPVRIATDRVRELDALRGDPDEVRARLSEHIPLRRYGEPEEFGRAAAFVLLTEVVEECQREGSAPGGDPEPLVAAVWALSVGIVTLWLDGPLEDRCVTLGTTPVELTSQIAALLEALLRRPR